MTTLANKIQDVFNEPGCDLNQKKSEKDRKKGCTKPLQPGGAAGGCAFDGAKIALQPITDVAHLVHGPIACEGNSWDNRNSGSSDSKLYRTSFTTDMDEQDIIFGGEKRLWRSIREITEKYAPPAIFVYQTCVPAMTGDHVEAVCKKASEKFGTPCIPVNAPGFVGAKTLGNKLAGEALLDYVIGTQEPEYTTPYDINIIGEYNVAGELWQVKPLLDELGVRILACISGDAKYKEVASSHRAKAAMMVCSRAMINVARKMEERYGIPYFEGSFYGISDMSDSLRNIARLLVERGAPEDLIARTEAVIEREERKAWAGIAFYRERLQGKKVLLITGGVKSWSVVSALQEGGMEIVGTSVKKSTQEDKDRIKEIMGEDAHMIDDMKPRDMYKMLKEARADIMLSGGRSQFVALKAKMPWLDINQERHYAYAGYDGMVALVCEIDKALSNPVWAQVRTPAPWDEVSWEERADKAIAEEAAALAANDADAAPQLTVAVEESWTSRVCNCKEVDEAGIEEAIRAHKLLRVDDVRAHTKAGTGCGSCIPRVAAILQRINGVKVPAFEQTPMSEAGETHEAAAIAPSPCPSPAGGEGTVLQRARPAPSPLAGEGWGEGDSAADLSEAPTKAA